MNFSYPSTVVMFTGLSIMNRLKHWYGNNQWVHCLSCVDTSLEIRLIEETTGGHIPIIAMTANAAEDDRQRCLAVGMDDHISKPILIDALHATLRRGMLRHPAAAVH